jgi:esterase/lipase superfamily enzyme
MWQREHHRWYSPALGRDMELLVLGHGGARVLVFPTSQGRFFEWEDRGMADAIGNYLEQGWFQLVCVDSVDAESWYARDRWPGDRAWRQEQYDRYLLHEVLPFSWHRNRTPFLIAAGASLGAYHAVNFAFRHPQTINRVIGLSGLYDIKALTRGYSDANVYAHDPSHYMIDVHRDHDRLAALRRQDIILAIGRDDPHYEDSVHMSRTLWVRDIWHAFRVWDGWAHDWPWWRQMFRLYVGGHD